MKINVYSPKGIKKGTTDLPKNLVEKENLFLLAQAVRVYEDRLHPRRGKTKTRGEVYASGAKIWRQKGTGRARHGDIAAPIFVGGGIAHGPRGVKKTLSLPKKIRQKAVKGALNLKVGEGQLVIGENLSSLKKTKDAQKFIAGIVNKELGDKKNTRVTIVLAKENASARIAFRNINNIQILDFTSLNAYSILLGGLLIIDKGVFNKKGVQKVESMSPAKEVKSESKRANKSSTLVKRESSRKKGKDRKNSRKAKP